MIPGASQFLGGDGWSLSADDKRGDTDNRSATGSMGDTNFNRGGAMSLPALVGIGAVILGGFYLMSRG